MQHIDPRGGRYQIFLLHSDAKGYVGGDAETQLLYLTTQNIKFQMHLLSSSLTYTLSTFKSYFYLSLPSLFSHVTPANLFPTHRKADIAMVVSAKSPTPHLPTAASFCFAMGTGFFRH